MFSETVVTDLPQISSPNPAKPDWICLHLKLLDEIFLEMEVCLWLLLLFWISFVTLHDLDLLTIRILVRIALALYFLFFLISYFNCVCFIQKYYHGNHYYYFLLKALKECEEKRKQDTERREEIVEAIAWYNKVLGFRIERGRGT